MKILKIFNIFIGLAFLISGAAYGAIIQVPDDYPTIQEAIDNAVDGDTILVAQGTYYENLHIENKNNITLKGEGINRSIIDGSGIGRVIHAQRNHDLSIVIKGFTVRNGWSGWGSGIFLNTGGPCCNSSINAVVRNCEVIDNYGTGIIIVNDWTGTSYVENNIISNNSYNGFEPYLGTYYLQHNTIVNNNRDGYSDWSGWMANVIIRNNIIASNGRYGIFKHSTTPLSISYNNVWNNEQGAYYEGDGGVNPFTPNPGTGEISEDPLFFGGGDYHLTFTSPCIDAGTDVGVYVDMDGDVRPFGAGFDMGADEFVLSYIEVDIDIKPGSYHNSINLKSRGKVPVAILTTADFDADDVDPDTCVFAGASPVRWNMEDVDHDGDHDMVMHCKTQELDLTKDSTEATLEGETHDGTPIVGTDSVNIVPKGKGNGKKGKKK